MDDVAPTKTAVRLQYAEPETLLCAIKNNKVEGITDGNYLTEIARCVEIDGSFGSQSLLESLVERAQLFAEHGPVLPEVLEKTVNILDLRFTMFKELSRRSKDGRACVMPHEELLFLQEVCKNVSQAMGFSADGLTCTETDQLLERIAVAERALTPLLQQESESQLTIQQFKKLVHDAQMCGVGHPKLEQMAMQMEEFWPWLRACKTAEQNYRSGNESLSFTTLKSLWAQGRHLTFVKEAREQKKRIDDMYQEAKSMNDRGEDLASVGRVPKPASSEVAEFLATSKKFTLPCHTTLSNLLATQKDLENQVKGIILDNNISFHPGNLFKALNIISQSSMSIDEEKIGVPSACWVAACRTIEFFEVRASNSIYLRIPIAAVRRLQDLAPQKRTEWHDYIDGQIMIYDYLLAEAAKTPSAWARLRLAAGVFPYDIIEELDKLKDSFEHKSINVQFTEIAGPPGSQFKYKGVKQIDLVPKGPPTENNENIQYIPMATMFVERPANKPLAGADKCWRDYLDVITKPDFKPRDCLVFLMSNSGSRAMMQWNEKEGKREMVDLPPVNVRGASGIVKMPLRRAVVRALTRINENAGDVEKEQVLANSPDLHTYALLTIKAVGKGCCHMLKNIGKRQSVGKVPAASPPSRESSASTKVHATVGSASVLKALGKSQAKSKAKAKPKAKGGARKRKADDTLSGRPAKR